MPPKLVFLSRVVQAVVGHFNRDNPWPQRKHRIRRRDAIARGRRFGPALGRRAPPGDGCLPDLTVAVFPLRSSVFLCFSKLTQYREVLAFEPRERFPCKLLPLRGVRDGKGQEADQCERTTWSGWTNGSGRSQGTPRKPHERDRATQRTDGSSRQGIASAVVAHRSDSSAIGSSRTRTGDPS